MRKKPSYKKQGPEMLHPHTEHYLISKKLNQLKKTSDYIVDILEI